MQPEMAVTKERERVLTETHTEMRFVMTESLKKQLGELRSLLGVKGADMNFAKLVDYMTGVSIQNLKAKKFGKKARMAEEALRNGKIMMKSKRGPSVQSKPPVTPTPEPQRIKSNGSAQNRGRYISKAIQHQIWKRDQGKCCQCSSQRNINIDHVKPVALGGQSHPENLRLLCFHCNQRQAMKTFGIEQLASTNCETIREDGPSQKNLIEKMNPSRAKL